MSRKEHHASPPNGNPANEAVGTGPPSERAVTEFPVVGIGASAGGLEPLKQFLRALPVDTGMAFVVVQHLAPKHASVLPEILARETAMTVEQVVDEPAVLPNHVYVIPPDRGMLVADGRFRLLPREEHGRPRSIDVFLRSLAQERGDRAIGIILSGTADDGTQGLEAIKAGGGITFAQDDSAQYSDMPKNAIAGGCVDFVLAPAAIADEIARIARHPFVVPLLPAQLVEPPVEPHLTRIVDLLREAQGVDFTHYRSNTLYRRITRRMVLHKLDGLQAYVKLLEKDRSEVEALFHDILISVTSFFRNPEAFEALKEKVFPRLAKDRSRHEPLRFWVLGCSTGEEAYSIAMAYVEFAEAAGSHVSAQIFATDLNAIGIEKARAGRYSKSIEEDVSPERLRRFFVEVDGDYRIAKSIRDMCVFARHDAFSDPPFSRIDLVSCRNLLIYFEPALQQKVLSVFHYALRPGGALWLGSSETIGPLRDLFEVEDARQKIYVKKPGPARLPARIGEFKSLPGVPQTKADREREAIAQSGAEIQREADRILLTRYVPPGVLVDSDMEILQFRGDTSPYLVPAPGKASLNLMKMAREGLLVGLRAAVGRARKDEAPAREKGLRVKSESGPRDVDLEVVPVRGSSVPKGCFLVVFDEPDGRARTVASAAAGEAAPKEESEREIVRMAQELSATREYLQSVIEEQEASNEELQSANEEVQSSNEELQSVNEELETSKEELQSSNEELATVNEELQNRNIELSQSNDDLANLINSAQMAILMLDRNMRIRRFTPSAGTLLNLIPADVGRPVTDIKLPIDVPDLETALGEAVDAGKSVERQVRDQSGRWHSLRIRPYKTNDGKTEGAVVALIDVDALKRAQVAVEESEERYRLLVDGAREFAIMMLDAEGRVATWNSGAQRILGFTAQEILGAHFARFFTPEDVAANRPEAVLRAAESTHGAVNDHWLLRKDGSRFWGVGTTTAVRDASGRVRGYAKVIRDMSDRKALEDDLRRRNDELAAADRSKNEFLAMLAHELRNPLAPLSNAIKLLKDPKTGDDVREEATETMDRHLGHMTRLVDGLLDVSRITQGKIQMRKGPVDAVALIREAVADALPQFESRGQEISVDVPPDPVWLDADGARLHQVFANLLDNASKFSDEGAHVEATAGRAAGPRGDEFVVRVRDHGIGIDAAMLPHVFDLFAQADSSESRGQGGLGIGLTLAKTLVELHDGVIEARSAGVGHGSEFVVRLPVPHASSPPRVAPAAPSNAASPTHRRVLLVDDNADAAKTLGMLLRAAGHDVQAVFSGPDCLATAAEFRPEVVVLDLGLPGMDGYEIAKRLRRVQGMGDVLLIALSGYGRPEDRRRTSEAGFAHHLLKPAKIETLLKILDSYKPK